MHLRRLLSEDAPADFCSLKAVLHLSNAGGARSWSTSFSLLLLVVALQVCPAHAQNPTVMITVDEKNLGSIATYEVQAVAAAMLQKDDVPVLDQDMIQADLEKDQALLLSAGDQRGAIAIGLNFGADIVLAGDAISKPAARGIGESDFRTYTAAVTLKAIRTDNSQTIATASETGTIVGRDDASAGAQALRKAAKKTLRALIPDMLKSWRDSGTIAGSRHVTLHIGSVDQMWKLKHIRKLLRSSTELGGNVYMKSYVAGVAIFEIDTTLAPEVLAEKLVLSPPQDLRFQILDVKPGIIEVNAVAE